MVTTTKSAPAPELSAAEELAGRISDARDVIEPIIRATVTGDANRGRVRRGVLFAVVGLGLVLGGLFAGLGIVALLFLALTDQVVEL